ncbi:MAG: helix-turn-helix domain-containing protein [Pseudomonadota bacterium]
MSGGALDWAKKTRVGSQSAKLVLLALADWADDAGSCFPSVHLIVEVTELSDRSVRAALRRLEDLGLLQTERTRRSNGAMGANRYFLKLGAKPIAQDVVGAGQPQCDGKAPPARGADGDHRQEVQDPLQEMQDPPAGDAGLSKDEPPIEPPMEPERERADARTPEGLEGDQSAGSTSGGTTSGALGEGPPFASFKRKWPNRAVDDMGKAQAEYDKLTATDREAAIDGIVPYREALRVAGRTKLHAAVNYLKQRKWEDAEGEPDPSAPYLPPHVPAFGALWSAAMIEMLRTGAFARKRYVFKQLCEGASNMSLAFGKERDGELVSAAERFTKAQASSEAGRAFLDWMDARFAAAKMPHQMPRFRDEFWMYVPPPDLAKAWGLDLNVAPPERSSPATERGGSKVHPPNDDETAWT